MTAASTANSAVVTSAAPVAAWSSWAPPSGSTAQTANAIAQHVSAQYHDSAGTQLAAVIAGPPQITQGNYGTVKSGKTGKFIMISEVAISKTSTSRTHLTIDPTRGAWTYQLCGFGNDCAIAPGEDSVPRGRLLRRAALEAALFTFKYDPAITSVIDFMPPPPGEIASTVLYFRASNYAQRLREPLSNTLRLATIDQLTQSDLFGYVLIVLHNGSAALDLTPVRS